MQCQLIWVSIFLDTFTTLSLPNDEDTKCLSSAMSERELPPWNGYGSYEDSAENCRTVEPKAPHRDFIKFLNKDRYELNARTISSTNCSQ